MKSYPLTQTQMGVYLSELNAAEDENYNINGLYRVDDGVDLPRLRVALTQVINAHPYVKSRLMQTDEGEIRIVDHSDEPPLIE